MPLDPELALLKTQFQQLPPKEASPFVISLKQIDYLQKLHAQSTLHDIPILSAIAQLLNNNVSQWSHLSRSQVSYLINYLLPNIIIKHDTTLAKQKLLKTRLKPLYRTRDIILLAHPEYEYGYQIKSPDWNLYYLRFYDMMMLDFDNMTLTEVRTRLVRWPMFAYRVYQTYNGFRVFIVSHNINYRDERVRKLMMDMGVDEWYIVFVQHHAYKVRLNKKPQRPDETYVAKWVEDIGDKSWWLPLCTLLINIHEKYLGLRSIQ